MERRGVWSTLSTSMVSPMYNINAGSHRLEISTRTVLCRYAHLLRCHTVPRVHGVPRTSPSSFFLFSFFRRSIDANDMGESCRKIRGKLTRLRLLTNCIQWCLALICSMKTSMHVQIHRCWILIILERDNRSREGGRIGLVR